MEEKKIEGGVTINTEGNDPTVQYSNFETTDDPITKEELMEKVKMERAMSSSGIYTQEVPVPSNGYFGGLIYVRIRRMTTAEEKIIYSAVDTSYISEIVKACVVSHKIDLHQLHANDVITLLYAIRNITFGDSYKQQVTCSDCRTKQIVDVNITEMPINILDMDTVDARLRVKLPDDGSEIQLRLLSEGEIKDIDKKIISDCKKRNIEDINGYEFTVKLCALVKTINGEEPESEYVKERFLMNLSMRDYNKLKKASSEVVNSFGIDRDIVYTCKKCGEIQEVTAVMVPEFFVLTTKDCPDDVKVNFLSNYKQVLMQQVLLCKHWNISMEYSDSISYKERMVLLEAIETISQNQGE